MGDSSCLVVVAVVPVVVGPGAIVGPGVGVGSSPSNKIKRLFCFKIKSIVLYTLEKGMMARRIMSVV